MFYTNIESCVINNGSASDYFRLEQGVRQGDPLSPYLFLLAVETLAIAIRENKEIKGIKIEQEETKLLQYADDTTANLSDLNSAQYLFQQLEFFKTLSGLEINSLKIEGLWIGSLKGNGIKPLGIKCFPRITCRPNVGMWRYRRVEMLENRNVGLLGCLIVEKRRPLVRYLM